MCESGRVRTPAREGPPCPRIADPDGARASRTTRAVSAGERNEGLGRCLVERVTRNRAPSRASPEEQGDGGPGPPESDKRAEPEDLEEGPAEQSRHSRASVPAE